MPTVTPDLVRTYVESDALRLAELVRSKAVTPAELTEVAISLIEQLDPKLNAIVIRAFDEARPAQPCLSATGCSRACRTCSRISGRNAKACP